MHAKEPNENNVKSAKFLIQHSCNPFRHNKLWHLPKLPALVCSCGNVSDLELVTGQDKRMPLKELNAMLKVACRFEKNLMLKLLRNCWPVLKISLMANDFLRSLLKLRA